MKASASETSQPLLAEFEDLAFGSVDPEIKELEKSYQTGEVIPYGLGLESFWRFCEDHHSSLSEIDEEFPARHPSKRHLELNICFSSRQDFDVFTMEEGRKAVVQVPADPDDAPIVQLIADNLITETSFRVRGYSGVKVVDMDLVITEGGVVESISPLLNCTLALSRTCTCGVRRPGPPDINPEDNIAVAFFLRLCCIVAKLLPCGCGDDARLSTAEETNNWYSALCTIVRSLEDLYYTLPMSETEGYMRGSYEGMQISLEDSRLVCTTNEEVTCSSFRSAAELVTCVCNAYIASEEANEDNKEKTEEEVQVSVLSERVAIAEQAGRLTQSAGATATVNWLCYNKLSHNGAKSVSISPFNAELRQALLYMDSQHITSLCGIPLCDLEKVRIPVLEESVGTAQVALHYAGSAMGVAMIPKEVVLKHLSVRCRPRARLESIKMFSQMEINHVFQGRTRTIAITPSGAVIAFHRRSRIVKNLLRGIRGISVLGNGVSFDLTEIIGNVFTGDTDLVNRALSWEYGKEVFHFILCHILLGNIYVQRQSPAASFVPESAKHDVGVCLYTLLDNRFFRDQTFVISKDPQSSMPELYWLPSEGMNYFKVVQNPDGLYAMKESTSTTGPLVYKCSAVFPRAIG